MEGPKAPATPSAQAAVFAEGLWAGLPAPAADDTLLLRGVSGAGRPVEGVEGAATLPPISERQAEATGARPPLSGAPEGPARTPNLCPQRGEGHPYEFFFRAPVTARDAMCSSSATGGRPCNASVARPVATP